MDPKPIVTFESTFPRDLCPLRVITSSFDWFAGLVKVITLVLVIRHTVETRAIRKNERSRKQFF